MAAGLTLRSGRQVLEAEVYAGLELARATAIPVNSPVLIPLDDFQPQSRQILAGAALRYGDGP